jgi:hypothetical protein
MPKIVPSLETELKLMKIVKGNSAIPIDFRNRVFEEINVPQNQSFTWRLGSKTENICYMIITFQTDKENNMKNVSTFDHCDLEAIYVEINGVRYPNYSFANIFLKHYYLPQYYEAVKFRQKFYNLKENQNKIQIDEYNFSKFYPFFVFDVTRQGDNNKNSAVDITIKANFRQNVKANTKCQCLIICERSLTLSSDGSKMIVN